MDDTGSSRSVGARERARLRDTRARARLGLQAQHGDVGPGGDLVDELTPSRRLNTQPALEPQERRVTSYAEPCTPPDPRLLSDRAERLAACITASNERMAQMHLELLLKTLERVPS